VSHVTICGYTGQNLESIKQLRFCRHCLGSEVRYVWETGLPTGVCTFPGCPFSFPDPCSLLQCAGCVVPRATSQHPQR
jgi:hypothetical protein